MWPSLALVETRAAQNTSPLFRATRQDWTGVDADLVKECDARLRQAARIVGQLYPALLHQSVSRGDTELPREVIIAGPRLAQCGVASTDDKAVGRAEVEPRPA